MFLCYYTASGVVSFKNSEMNIVSNIVSSNYAPLENIFTDMISRYYSGSLEWKSSMIANVAQMVEQCNVTGKLSLLMSGVEELKNTEYEAFKSLNAVVGLTTMSEMIVLNLIARLNEIMSSMNNMISFESELCKFVLEGSGMDLKRSDVDSNAYRKFSQAERVMIHLCLFADIVCNHEKRDVIMFYRNVDGLLAKEGMKRKQNRLMTKIRDIYNSVMNVNEDVGVCVSDTFMFMRMIDFMYIDENVNGNSISKLELGLEGARGELARWNDQRIMTTVIQNRIYLNKLHEGQLNRAIHEEFVRSHGGNFVNVLGYMYGDGSRLRYLYAMMIVYGLMVDWDKRIVDTNVSGKINGGYMVNVNGNSFDVNNGVIEVSCKDPLSGKMVSQVIERQNGGYVYRSLGSGNEMNFGRVIYNVNEIGNVRNLLRGGLNAINVDEGFRWGNCWSLFVVYVILVGILVMLIRGELEKIRKIRGEVNGTLMGDLLR